MSSFYEEFSRISGIKDECIDSIISKGPYIDSDVKLEDFYKYIDFIKVAPNVGSLQQMMLDVGAPGTKAEYPAGTLLPIPYTYNYGAIEKTVDVDFIVADYTTYKLDNGKYAEAAVIQSSVCFPELDSSRQNWVKKNVENMADYGQSNINFYLNSDDFLSGFPASFTSKLRNVMVPYQRDHTETEAHYVATKCFIPSEIEMSSVGKGANYPEHDVHVWEYWKAKIPTPSAAANANRKFLKLGTTDYEAIYLRFGHQIPDQDAVYVDQFKNDGTWTDYVDYTNDGTLATPLHFTPCFAIVGKEFIATTPKEFKAAMIDGTAQEKFPVGTTIFDKTSAGIEDDLVVVHYGTMYPGRTDKEFKPFAAAFLARKNILTAARQFNTTATCNSYYVSSMYNYLTKLNNDYTPASGTYELTCSNDIRKITNVVFRNANTADGDSIGIRARWMLPTAHELSVSDRWPGESDIKFSYFANEDNRQTFIDQAKALNANGFIWTQSEESPFSTGQNRIWIMADSKVSPLQNVNATTGYIMPICVVLPYYDEPESEA